MVALGKKMQEIEPDRNRLLRDNTRQLQTITRLERERDKAKLEAEGMRAKMEAAEENLKQALAEIDATKKVAYDEGHQKGFETATASYVQQMPAIQDQIWAAGWEACLVKIGAPDESILWVENDLPSKQAAAAAPELEEDPVDDIDQAIDEFADADEEIQMEASVAQPGSQEAHSEQPTIEGTTTETVNLEEQQTGDGNAAVAPSNTTTEVQNLD